MRRVFGGLLLSATCLLFTGCPEPDRSIDIPEGELPKMGESKSIDTGSDKKNSGAALPAPPP
ncbi:MAG: hypothetical protein CMJ59_20305 [Planctomycetaceae bacterium]|nr:hypothetical protein [Planctomycetaceae bacterium]